MLQKHSNKMLFLGYKKIQFSKETKSSLITFKTAFLPNPLIKKKRCSQHKSQAFISLDVMYCKKVKILFYEIFFSNLWEHRTQEKSRHFLGRCSHWKHVPITLPKPTLHTGKKFHFFQLFTLHFEHTRSSLI